VKSGERIETVLTIEGKNNYEYMLFEDLKPAGLEAVEVRSGESLYARELMAGAVERKFGATSIHEVKPGETLSELAKAYGVPIAEIEKANTGVDPKRLRIGAKLVMPPTPSRDYETGYTGRQRWFYQELVATQSSVVHRQVARRRVGNPLRPPCRSCPGQFHALPVLGQAMYVPEIRANSAEVRINVEDAK